MNKIMVDNIKRSVVKRFSEPSTWAALGVSAISLGLLFDSWSSFFGLVALIVSAAAIILKENGTS